MRLVRDPAGQPLEIVGYWIDISPRKLAEEALRKSQANLEEAQAMARLGSWEHDLSTQRISWSREMFTLFHRDPALGPPSLAECWELIHPEDRPQIQNAYAQALATGQTYMQEFRTNPKEGQPRHMVGTLKNVEYAAGKPVRLIGTTLDITERKKLEDYLRQLNEVLENRVRERTAQLQEANAELQAFSFSVSHDLRAPLRAMSGLSQIVFEDYGALLDETARKHLQGISKAAQDMDALIQDLLAYSRLGRAEVTLGPINLDTVLAKAQSQLTEEIRQRQAEVTVSNPLPRVIGHEGILVQVLANLLANAVKFVTPNVRPQIRIWAEQQEKLVRLWVEDNGLGIAPEHQERIFKVFERLHSAEAYPGTGIGLAIVRRGITRMQGQVGLESQLGQGSRFWIELLGP